VGAEAICALNSNGDRHTGRALLETDELIFHGNDGYRVKVAFATLRSVEAVNGKLLLDGPAGAIALELGDEKAKRWAERIRSPKSLLDKLDLKPAHTVVVIGSFDAAFMKDLASRVAKVVTRRAPKSANVAFLWADGPPALKKLATVAKSIARDGAIWVVHAKGPASKVKDTDVFAAGKKAGLTATKIARFSETHTAEKLVIPVVKR
jgi:hypothetical protein